MSDYDATIKALLNGGEEGFNSPGLSPVVQWLNVELPNTKVPRVDLLARTLTEQLVHIELQSSNDGSMPLRMAEYALAILRRYKEYPHQLVLYVGNGTLRMKTGLESQGMRFHYDLVDIRDLDPVRLLASGSLADNILAIFARIDKKPGGIRQILRNIAKLNEQQRGDAVRWLMQAAELRDMQHTVSEEICKMPIIHKTSINDKTFGPWIRKGLEQGRQEGLEKGRTEAFQRVVRLQLEKRFGPLSAAIIRRVSKLSERQVEKLALAIVDGKSLGELFPASSIKR